MGTMMVSSSASNLFAVGVISLRGQQAQEVSGLEFGWTLA
jgi:hypothetical protein